MFICVPKHTRGGWRSAWERESISVLCGSWGLNAGDQATKPVPLPTEPSLWPWTPYLMQCMEMCFSQGHSHRVRRRFLLTSGGLARSLVGEIAKPRLEAIALILGSLLFLTHPSSPLSGEERTRWFDKRFLLLSNLPFFLLWQAVLTFPLLGGGDDGSGGRKKTICRILYVA